jgi:acetyl-CoA acyltransferase
MRDVFIIGVGMTRFGKHFDRSIKDLTREAVERALADAGIEKEDLRAAWFSNSMWGYFSEQHCIRGHAALGAAGIMSIPIFNTENACGGGASAFHQAWLAVVSGVYECVMAVGTEKLYHEDREKSFGAYASGIDVENAEQNYLAWKSVLENAPLDIPFEDDVESRGKSRSQAMDMYAWQIRWHMATYGTTQRHLAVISSKNHFHSTMNPNAQYQKDMSVEEVLAGRIVIWPLTVPMCSPVGDGSAAAILCSGDYLKRLKSPRPVKILASAMGSHTDRSFSEEDKDIARRVSRQAYETAGVGPEDIDVAELHDATAFGELHQTEALGFCAPGEGGPFAETGATRLGGRLPINTSGGLESRGHPLGATGLGQIHEVVTQLRGEAGKRQVEGARIGLTENGGGNMYFEEAALAIHILEGTKTRP